MSAASDQKLFCKLCSPFCCSFDEFVEEKVISPSYSSAIFKSSQFCRFWEMYSVMYSPFQESCRKVLCLIPLWPISSLWGWLLLKQQKIISVDEDVKKLEPLCTVDRNVKWCSHCEKQYGSTSEINCRITIWLSNSIFGYIPKSIESRVLKRYAYIYSQ